MTETMTETSQLPHLLRLLDDDSPIVRKAIIKAFAAFGPGLPAEIKRLPDPLTPAQIHLLQECLQTPRRRWLRQKWPGWFSLTNDDAKLEAALSLISEFQNNWDETESLGDLLDRLAGEYRSLRTTPDPLHLAEFLFQTQGFKGAVRDYYQPYNSNIMHVIRHHKGIPISLSCLYILVGRRLGLSIRGCNLPRHFLSIVVDKDRRVLVDCYHGGKIVEDGDIKTLSQETSMTAEEALRLEADADVIIQRMLGNMVWAYQQARQQENGYLMIHLLRQLQHDRYLRQADAGAERSAPDFPAPSFQPGQRICHRREGFRAIIVDYDWYCMAGDTWYQNFSSQASRNQPWYHVLVHGTDQVRYVAQSDLAADPSGDKISHPLLDRFFDGAQQGEYRRNAELWMDD